MKFTSILALTTICALSATCAKKKSHNRHAGVTPEMNLTPEQSQAFEIWKKSPVKACDPAQAFGLQTQGRASGNSVDMVTLVNSNNGSLVFTSKDQLAVLGSYDVFAGTIESNIDTSATFNGRGHRLVAQAKQNSGNCELFLYGKSVFTTFLASRVHVTAHWKEGKTVTGLFSNPKISAIHNSATAEATGTGSAYIITELLRPTKDSISLLLEKLHISAEDANSLVNISNYSKPMASMRAQNDSASIWTSVFSSEIVGSASMLANIFNGTPQTYSLETRVKVPHFDFRGTQNSADLGTLKMVATIAVAKADASLEYTSQNFEFKGFSAFDPQEQKSCVTDRFTTYSNNLVTTQGITPSVASMFEPCATLSANIEQFSFETGLMRSLVPLAFKGVTPRKLFNYAGWDSVLTRLVFDAQTQGKDIQAELDPDHQTEIIGSVAETFKNLNLEISISKNLAPHTQNVLEMGLNWVFQGDKVLDSRIRAILRGVAAVIDVFEESGKLLLADLAEYPNSRDDDLAFASAIDATYKDAATQALNIAKELSYPNLKLEIFDRAIQKRISLDTWRDWSEKLTSIKNEISRFNHLGSQKGALVGLSVKWLSSGEERVGGLSSIYAAIDNAMIPFEKSTAALITALSNSLADNRSTLAFAATLSPEYKQLAETLKAKAIALDVESWGNSFFDTVLQKKPDLERLKQWNNLLIALESFAQREATRVKDEFASRNKSLVSDIIERALAENWVAANILALETIAPVALGTISCEDKKGMSTLADCGNFELFSNTKHKFFDPNYGDRYSKLAQDFITYNNRLTSFTANSLRQTINREFFGFDPMWHRCDATSFAAKSQSLKTEINGWIATSDQFAKWEIERKINNIIDDCQ